MPDASASTTPGVRLMLHLCESTGRTRNERATTPHERALIRTRDAANWRYARRGIAAVLRARRRTGATSMRDGEAAEKPERARRAKAPARLKPTPTKPGLAPCHGDGLGPSARSGDPKSVSVYLE